MLFLQFSDITDTHIIGRWKQISAMIPPRAELFAFKDISEIAFLPDNYCIASAPVPLSAKWRLEHHRDIIPNPVIYFHFHDKNSTESAMITRYSYMPDKYGENKNDEMILYFSNGCEIVLEKISKHI